jgi:hypothetical protein
MRPARYAAKRSEASSAQCASSITIRTGLSSARLAVSQNNPCRSSSGAPGTASGTSATTPRARAAAPLNAPAPSRTTTTKHCRTTPIANSCSSGEPRPARTRIPVAAPSPRATASRLVLPMPAGPSTNTVLPAPSRAASSAAASRASSSARPTSAAAGVICPVVAEAYARTGRPARERDRGRRYACNSSL